MRDYETRVTHAMFPQLRKGDEVRVFWTNEAGNKYSIVGPVEWAFRDGMRLGGNIHVGPIHFFEPSRDVRDISVYLASRGVFKVGDIVREIDSSAYSEDMDNRLNDEHWRIVKIDRAAKRYSWSDRDERTTQYSLLRCDHAAEDDLKNWSDKTSWPWLNMTINHLPAFYYPVLEEI